MKTLLTIVIAALSLNAFGQVPEYVPTDGLVAWWPFNGNAFDESDYQNDGTVNGASLTEDRFGNPNSAYSFDGVDDFIGVNSLNAFQYNPVSYSFWYVLETLCTNTAYNTFCAKLAIGRDVSGNTLQGSIGLINNTEPDYTFNKFAYYTGCCTGLTEFTPSLHEWHQLVMIYDVNETLKWYHDGELISSESFASGSDANIPFNIGSGGNRHFWDGILDDLGVWNRSLSDEEVQALYLANLYVTGCTDSTACNYNPDAIEDDGNCDYSCCPGPGCCSEGLYWDWELEQCFDINPTDSNLDGCTDLNDLMDLLGAYGDCAEVNYSLSFDGVDDYVNMGSFNNYNLNNSSTSITAILKINVSQFGYQDAGEAYIFGTPMFGGNNDRGFRIETKPNNTFGIAAGGNSNIVYTYSGNKQINTWYDIAMVLDQSQDVIYLYVDGVLESQVSISQIGTINNAYNLNIGAFENISWISNLFSGLVDDVSIWNSALTQEQIQSYMSTPPTGNEEGLVGYWDFNEGTGNTLTDQTSNGNDGVINGATWSTDVPTAP